MVVLTSLLHTASKATPSHVRFLPFSLCHPVRATGGW